MSKRTLLYSGGLALLALALFVFIRIGGASTMPDEQAGALRITAYRGYGDRTILNLQGRVLSARHYNPERTAWDNALNTLRRFASREQAGVRVRATFQDVVMETVTDGEGYFTFALQPDEPLPEEGGWQRVALALVDERGQTFAPATGHVLVPPASADFGVISDIDDTVLQTHATNLMEMARTTFFESGRTRLPFAGVAEFYQALQAGPGGDDGNPIFYVSNSPWNLYEMLVEFMQTHGLPAGPLFLQDFGFDQDKFLMLSSEAHKLPVIRGLLDFYPDLPFVLIGDSGQQDPEIYTRIIEEYPGRILAVYIRDVSDDPRDAEVEALAAAAAADGVELLLVPDSTAAARHAAEHGLIVGE
jgi:phosphatidate phosphatase APP1